MARQKCEGCVVWLSCTGAELGWQAHSSVRGWGCLKNAACLPFSQAQWLTKQTPCSWWYLSLVHLPGVASGLLCGRSALLLPLRLLCFGVRIGFFVKQAFPLTTLLAPACWAVGTHHDVLWVTMSTRGGLPAFVGEMGRGQEPLRLWGMTDQDKPEDRLLLHSLDPFYKVLIPIIGRARGFAL